MCNASPKRRRSGLVLLPQLLVGDLLDHRDIHFSIWHDARNFGRSLGPVQEITFDTLRPRASGTPLRFEIGAGCIVCDEQPGISLPPPTDLATSVFYRASLCACAPSDSDSETGVPLRCPCPAAARQHRPSA